MKLERFLLLGILLSFCLLISVIILFPVHLLVFIPNLQQLKTIFALMTTILVVILSRKLILKHYSRKD
jgi:hypothetical protein